MQYALLGIDACRGVCGCLDVTAQRFSTCARETLLSLSSIRPCRRCVVHIGTRCSCGCPDALQMPWAPHRHRTFGPECHAVFRALALGMTRLAREGAIVQVDPACIEWVLEGVQRDEFD